MTIEQLAEQEYPKYSNRTINDRYREIFIKGLKIGQQLAQWCGAEAMMNMDIEEITTMFLTEKYGRDEK